MDEWLPTISIEERMIIVELIEVVEDVPLDESNLEKFTRIQLGEVHMNWNKYGREDEERYCSFPQAE